MIGQRLRVREIQKLRDSAKDAPHCFSCGKPNRGGNLVLAHANDLRLGRGTNFKTPDYYGAIVCSDGNDNCHLQIDEKVGNLTKAGAREKQRLAHEKTLMWWFEEGYLS